MPTTIQAGEEHIRRLFLQVPFAMCVYRGENFVVELANERMLQFWNRAEAEVLGQPIFDVITEARGQGYETMMAEAMRTGRPFSAVEQPVTLMREGSVADVYMDLTYVPLSDEGGRVTGILTTVTDVTDRVIARQRIETAVKERTDELAVALQKLQQRNSELAGFAHVASHDLQEPLRKMEAFTSMLRRHLGEPDEKTNFYMDKVTDAAGRMRVLITDLLSLSELEVVRHPHSDVRLNAVLKQTLEDLEVVMVEKGATVTSDLLPQVNGVARQMGQVFANLLSNALKYARPGVPPAVHIHYEKLEPGGHPRLRPDVAFHHITFADNGIGFAPQYADRIFGAFERLHGRKEYAGTGIGLAICKKIAEQHGGTIWATSEEGVGSEFHLCLPAA